MDANEAKPRWASQRRVPRASRACEICRSRKTKCDQAQPCSYCAYHSFDCIYRSSGGRGTARESLSRKKRASRGVQTNQDNAARPSPWPGVHPAHTPSTNCDPERSTTALVSGVADSPVSLLRDPAHALTPEAPVGQVWHDGDAAVSESGDAASRDGLSGLNLHTNGTEFYGNSSNLAFLGNLFARAQSQTESRDLDQMESQSPDIAQTPSANRPQAASPGTRSMSGKQQLSIVNLLYNADYTGHPSPQSYDSVEGTPSKGQAHADEPRRDVGIISTEREIGLDNIFSQITFKAQVEIEKIFIGSFFSNKHYIHPVLSKPVFMRRCEQEAWPLSRRPGLFRGATKFGCLYFAVVALGAINASPNETTLLDHFCQQRIRSGSAHVQSVKFSSLDFAKFYFGAARQALGDFLESSCLETAQALLFMSVFRQNSLQPHSCYMYSGMAVRTAAAIGLASSMSSLAPSARREAKRTWWCIFSHETEMCCSSGRLDSMKELQYYQVALPKLKVDVGDHDPDGEDKCVAMIPVMVSLAQIMSEASHQLYHSTHRSMRDKSCLAMDLDARLLNWKSNIPSFLNPDSPTLNDPEWAFKQKLVLRLRYYNTRILIHRPFLVASTANARSNEFLQHLRICLDAARMSIQMQYESFMHRIYIRTWWYNTTYALYGAMILLHLVLSNFPGLPDDELLGDVDKSLEIFQSMEDIIVARRCAEMLREVLEVARACLVRRRGDTSVSGQSTSHLKTQPRSGSQGLRPSEAPATSSLASSSLPFGPVTSISGSAAPRTSGDATHSASNLSSELPLALSNPSSTLGPLDLRQAPHLDEEDFFFSLFSQGPEQQADSTRTEMLANLVDPSILENFAFGGQDFSFS